MSETRVTNYGAGYDLAARRKNATRESTATLKAWLNEHKKNPYPTKGEKIMLAIITKMTLTQVSTWFANARRRLKKENKMTWEPKNKTDDDDDALVSDGEDKDKDDDDKRDDTDIHGRIKLEHPGKDIVDDDDLTDEDRKDHSMMLGGAGGTLGLANNHLSGSGHLNSSMSSHHHHSMLLGSGTYSSGGMKTELKNSNNTDCGIPLPPSKPKIWSLADTAACKTPPPPPPPSSHHSLHSSLHHSQHQQHHQQQQHQAHQQQHHWLGGGGGSGSGSNGFALPTSRFSGSGGAGGFLPSHCQQAFPDIQTDTPPQTPPSMKLPNVSTSSNLGGGQASAPCIGGAGNLVNYGSTAQQQQQQHSQNQQNNNFLSGFGRLHSPHGRPPPAGGGVAGQMSGQIGGVGNLSGSGNGTAQNNDSSAAFKPFYKSSASMNGGFVSPV